MAVAAVGSRRQQHQQAGGGAGGRAQQERWLQQQPQTWVIFFNRPEGVCVFGAEAQPPVSFHTLLQPPSLDYRIPSLDAVSPVGGAF